MPTLPIRLPAERLAGCVWLARFVDKARLAHAGQLPPDYAFAFCHPRATDGQFLGHFGLEKAATLAALAMVSDDEAAAAWFLTQPGVNADRITAWNEAAPRLGLPGEPCERELRMIIRRLFGDNPPPLSPPSIFGLIEWDERETGR